MRKTKTLKFDVSDPREKALFDYLQTLPHGTFTEETKRFWRERMERDMGRLLAGGVNSHRQEKT